MMVLDDKDLKILDILKENAKLTSHQISKQTRIPITTVHNRVKKLEKEGIIKGYTLKLDWKKLDKGLAAYVLVTVSYFTPEGKKLSQEGIARDIKKLPEVQRVCIVTGEADIVIEVRVKDIDELNTFIIDKLRNIEGVDKARTMVVLSEI